MHILMTGASGLIGSNLIPKLRPAEITVLTRNVSMAEQVLGHKVYFLSSLNELENLDQFDVVINLAGEPIVNKKWTDEQKEILCHSRWDLTEKLVSLLKAGKSPPSLFISGSAIGYYGRQQDQEIDEDFSDVNDEFTHQLCERWEQLALEAQSPLTRVCIMRTGIVISKRGGALTNMLKPFRLGLGGPIASGQQYMSWIHLQDVLDGMVHLIEHEDCSGLYNFTAPKPETNLAFSQALAHDLNRPCFMRMPEWLIRMMMGEMADLVVYGQRVIPKRLVESGYIFTYPDLSNAFECLKLH